MSYCIHIAFFWLKKRRWISNTLQPCISFVHLVILQKKGRKFDSGRIWTYIYTNYLQYWFPLGFLIQQTTYNYDFSFSNSKFWNMLPHKVVRRALNLLTVWVTESILLCLLPCFPLSTLIKFYRETKTTYNFIYRFEVEKKSEISQLPKRVLETNITSIQLPLKWNTGNIHCDQYWFLSALHIFWFEM